MNNWCMIMSMIKIHPPRSDIIIPKDSQLWSSEVPRKNSSDQACRKRQALRQVKSGPNCHLIQGPSFVPFIFWLQFIYSFFKRTLNFIFWLQFTFSIILYYYQLYSTGTRQISCFTECFPRVFQHPPGTVRLLCYYWPYACAALTSPRLFCDYPPELLI